MKNKYMRIPIILSTLFVLGGLFPSMTVYASTTQMNKERIVVGGNVFSQPYGFANHGTTYMPLFYVMQVLKSVGVENVWDGRTWGITSSSSGQVSPINQSMNDQLITINGQVFSGVKTITANDPTSRSSTTYIPVWYIMQVLNVLGIQNTWDGQTWSISPSPNSTQNTTQNTTYGIYRDIALQNSATNDSTYWQRLDENYFVSAQTNNPDVQGSKSKPAVSVYIGQTIYLTAYSETGNVPASATSWYVNSSDATITPDSRAEVSGLTNQEVAVASFDASKPGIYTVQAKIDSNYSVPLVITVGLSQLHYQVITQPDGQSGIKPLPAQIQAAGTQTDNLGGTYSVGYPQGNWIPVYGKVPAGTKSVGIVLMDQNLNEIWSYTLPATNGAFGSEIFCPVSDDVSVNFDPNLLQDMTNMLVNNADLPDPPYVDVTVNGSDASQDQIDLLASAKMDYNMDPFFAQEAEILMENAPTVTTGIEAVNNWVANYVKYDNSELQFSNYRLQDSLTTLRTQLGVCMDYAELESSMLRSFGRQVETIPGSAQDPTGGDLVDTPEGHEWLTVWNGQQWILADPTWSTADNAGNLFFVSNEFFTETTSFTASHLANTSMIGSDM